MACAVMACVVMVYIAMVYIAMAHVVMAHIVMAYVVMAIGGGLADVADSHAPNHRQGEGGGLLLPHVSFQSSI